MKNKEEIEKIKLEIKSLQYRLDLLETEISTEDAKKDLLELVGLCKLRTEEGIDSIFFDNDDETFFEADFKNNMFWVRYKFVWSFFEITYGYNYDQIKELCKTMLENNLKWKGLTPGNRKLKELMLLENNLKWKGLTPESRGALHLRPLENNLKWKGLTPHNPTLP